MKRAKQGIDYSHTLNEIHEYREAQEEKVIRYEETSSWSMADVAQ